MGYRLLHEDVSRFRAQRFQRFAAGPAWKLQKNRLLVPTSALTFRFVNPNPDETDEQLSAQDGKGGFETLYERHAPHVLAYLTRSAGHSDASDLSQEVWLSVHASLPKIFPFGTFKSWLFNIAKNKNIDHARKRPLVELKIDLGDRSSDALESILDEDRIARLRACLDILRSNNLRSADVFTFLLLGRDVADIGNELNLDAQQVYNIKNKTLPVLQECVSKERA